MKAKKLTQAEFENLSSALQMEWRGRNHCSSPISQAKHNADNNICTGFNFKWMQKHASESIPADYRGHGRMSLPLAKKLLSIEKFKLMTTDYAEYTRNFSTTPDGEVPRIKISRTAMEELRRIRGPVIHRSTDIPPQPPKPRKLPSPQTKELTDGELATLSETNGWLCSGCKNRFGGYVFFPDNSMEHLEPQHGHVTNPRGMGGDKTNDYPVCGVCQRFQGNGVGISLEALQEISQREFQEQGLVYVPEEIIQNYVRSQRDV